MCQLVSSNLCLLKFDCDFRLLSESVLAAAAGDFSFRQIFGYSGLERLSGTINDWSLVDLNESFLSILNKGYGFVDGRTRALPASKRSRQKKEEKKRNGNLEIRDYFSLISD